jgi:hypothetical protein
VYGFGRGRRRFHDLGRLDYFFDRRGGFRLFRDEDAQFPAEPVGQTILDRIRMRRYRHAHVL